MIVDTFIIIILVCICGFMISGYAIYRLYPESTERWEDGVSFMIHLVFDPLFSLAKFIYKKVSEKLLTDQTVDMTYMLTEQETLDLIDTLKDHPYDTPALASYIPNVKGISWIDLKAVGLVGRYKDITYEQITQICRNIIETYFMKTRGCQVAIYIRVATPTRLYFAVPLSEAGKRFLDRQKVSAVESVSEPMQDMELTETVPERSPDTEENR